MAYKANSFSLPTFQDMSRQIISLKKNSNGRAAQIVYNSDDSSIADDDDEHYRERGEQLRLQMGPASTPAKPSVDGGGEEDEENE